MDFALSEQRLSMPWEESNTSTWADDLHRVLGGARRKQLKEVVESYAFGAELGRSFTSVSWTYYEATTLSAACRSRERLCEKPEIQRRRGVHNSIIETYREDFQKYAPSRNLARMQHVLNFVARNVGRKSNTPTF